MTSVPSIRHARFALLVLAATLPFVVAGCTDTVAQVQAAPAAPPVSVAAAIERDVVETQEFSGRIEAVDRAEIRPRVSGTIDAVRFVPGAEVRKGDVLVVIDPRPYRAEAARAEAVAASAIAKIDLAKTQLERSKRLLADNAIAQRDFDERLADTKQLDADARAARATADLAQLNLAFTQVRAPISGRVSKAEVTVGNLVDANVILTSVVSSNPVYASFEGDEQTFARLGGPARALNTTVNVGLVGEDGFPHAGRLEFIDNRVDPGTGSVRMRAVLDNRDGLMAAGRFARVSIGGGERKTRVVLVDDPRDRHRPGPQVRVRVDAARRRRQVLQGRLPRGEARAGDRRPARGPQRPEAGRADRGQRPAARAARRTDRTAGREDGFAADGSRSGHRRRAEGRGR